MEYENDLQFPPLFLPKNKFAWGRGRGIIPPAIISYFFPLLPGGRQQKNKRAPSDAECVFSYLFPSFFKFMNASPLSLVRMREIDISIHFFFSLKLPRVACRTPVLGKKDKKTCLVKKEPMTLLAKNPTQRGESRFAKSSFEF